MKIKAHLAWGEELPPDAPLPTPVTRSHLISERRSAIICKKHTTYGRQEVKKDSTDRYILYFVTIYLRLTQLRVFYQSLCARYREKARGAAVARAKT